MIKKLRKYIIISVAALVSTSCLNKYPDDSIPMDNAIKTVEDVNALVFGIYDAFKSPSLYSGHLTLLPDIQTDLVYGVNGNTNIYGNVWRWKDIHPTNPEIEGIYGSLYEIINRCNFLLDNVEKVKESIKEAKEYDKLEQYTGEAIFARALAYSELIKCFCKPYESDEAAEKELGVVLTKHYKGNEPLKRSTLKEAYDFVLNDLDKAAELLKLEEDFSEALFDSEYFNENTVNALRARVYLYMKRWDDAVKYSTKVIDSKFYLLSSCTELVTPGVSYYKYMWTNDLSTETIWKVGFTTTSYRGFGTLGQVFANFNYQTLRPDYVPAAWVLTAYNEKDLRKTTIFQNFTTGYSHGLTWPLLIKYFGNEQLMNMGVLHMCMAKVFRLSEQYLIRAEAYANLKDYSSASNDISKLRTARYASYGGSTPLSESNAMEVIEQERVKELFMEGFRLNDLKRWHKGFERKPQDQSISNGSSLKVKKDDPLFVWPIPQHDIEAPGAQIEPNESNK